MFKEIWGGVPAKGFPGNPTFNESGVGASAKGFPEKPNAGVGASARVFWKPNVQRKWGWGLSKSFLRRTQRSGVGASAKGFPGKPNVQRWGYIIEGINEFCPIFYYIVSI